MNYVIQTTIDRFADYWWNLTKRLIDAGRLPTRRARYSGSLSFMLREYGDHARHHHTCAHIVDTLDAITFHWDKFVDPDLAMLVAFYHDIKYDPARQDNEEESVRIMREVFDGELSEADVKKCGDMILATRKHVSTGDPDTELFLDIDMAILGREYSRYIGYAIDIMNEYVPVYGAEKYSEGRLELFLKPMLARENIFLTEHFRRYDAQAKENMTRERLIHFQYRTPGL